ARGMIRRAARSVVAGEVQFSFKHSLVREVAYQTLTRAARRTRHETVARHLERLPGLDLAGFATVLAHHWRGGGENEKGVEYLLIAAERAGAAWAREEMAGLYQSAIDLAGDKDPELRRRITLQRALANVRLTDFETGTLQLEELLPQLEGGDRVEALLGLAWSTYWQEDVGAALICSSWAAERLAKVAYELGGKAHSIQPLLRGGAWTGLAIAAQGRSEEAIEWLERIFVRAQDMDPRWGAATLNYSSLAFRDMFMFDEARRRNERALLIVAERGAWGMPELESEIDMLFTDLAVGDFGRVQVTFPRLWDAAINGKAWRPWLGGTRLALVRAELARLTEDAVATAEHARDALERARKTHRKKY